MKHKECTESNLGQEVAAGTRKTGKQLGIFLVICLPVTWLLMGIGYKGMSGEEFVPWANFLLTLACFIPAIAAIVASLITKESLWNLQFMPKLKGNAKIYFASIAIGVIISCTDLLLMTIFFQDKARFHEDATVAIVVFSVLFMIAGACLQFWVLMGEELGWMGYLFPRLEKLCGTTLALIVTGVIRGCWHLVMFVQEEYFLAGFLSLCVSNILLGSVLVWATKASKSVVPASIIHALTNGLPGAFTAYMVLDDSIYSNAFNSMDVFCLLPAAVVGVVCYIVLIKKYKVKKIEK